ncbi:MAG TPA: sigma-54 dependent transcriptional regulator, partial [Polyangiaceae bacterium]|nr:sigma-54 dependent transcriptional regulator [Polyangiaceae bacterium]
RAKVMLSRAESERAPVRAKAETALLRAMLARAEGQPFDALVRVAVQACRDSDEDELLREAHVLAYRAAADDSAWQLAGENLEAAVYYRDRVAAGLPPSLRSRYLEKHDVAVVDRELAFLRDAARAGRTLPGELPEATESRRSAPPSLASNLSVGTSTPSRTMPPRGRGIVGSDAAIRALHNAIAKVGPADATVLIHGESGTGKELVAEAVHAASQRRSGPLVKVNCAALVETLLLSELFGHEKGAFTGAASNRRGRFEAAEGGTLFLDEIGDISPRTQVALLRVLQEKTFERVGGTTSVRANVRVVCATHRDLKALVARGEFREDLYYRLCGVTLTVPALRNRLGDLGAISDALLARVAEERGGSVKRLSPRALTALKSHIWPGNVRELENALRAASLFAEGELLEPEDFAENVESLRHIAAVAPASVDVPAAGATLRGLSPSAPATLRGTSIALDGAVASQPSIRQLGGADEGARDDWSDALSGAPGPTPSGTASNGTSSGGSGGTPSDVAYAQVRAGTSLHDMKRIIERECIARALGDAGGNITRAATLLGMKRPRLSQLVKQYGLGSDADLADAGGDGAFGDDGADGSVEEAG